MRIVSSDQAKADIRAIPRHVAIYILTAIQRLAESGAGRVTALQNQDGDKRLRVVDCRVRFTVEHPGTLHIQAVKNRREAYRRGDAGGGRIGFHSVIECTVPGYSGLL